MVYIFDNRTSNKIKKIYPKMNTNDEINFIHQTGDILFKSLISNSGKYRINASRNINSIETIIMNDIWATNCFVKFLYLVR